MVSRKIAATGLALGSKTRVCSSPVLAEARQWMRRGLSPGTYGRTPDIRIGSSTNGVAGFISPSGCRAGTTRSVIGTVRG